MNFPIHYENIHQSTHWTFVLHLHSLDGRHWADHFHHVERLEALLYDLVQQLHIVPDALRVFLVRKFLSNLYFGLSTLLLALLVSFCVRLYSIPIRG
ncbi:hypothetical protein H7C19_13990 [Cohnella nanjingensis]|uniref:Uncharacterized protein n=1 Tax=Cohnella nanjingensis TaxID=1387779 RepID=A0A7X0VFZ6_9BACL|nr:hypothetical protein [Cohnella nanjingensis]